MAGHLVLLGTPRELHIPYFAMAVPRSRESYVERLNIEVDLVGLVGRRCASWIKSRQENVELIATRNYLFPRTAIYTKWLLFKDETTVADFLNSYPKYRLDNRLKAIGAERRALAIKLQERLRRGDFDLGRVGDEQQRENLARRYVETADTLRVLSSQLSLVDMARQLAERWQNEL
jgi:hypothetical protein